MIWLRWYTDVLHDPKLMRIARELNINYAEAVGAWGLLLALGSDSPIRGHLLISDGVPLTTEDVSETFHVTLHETEAMLHAFRKYGLLVRNGDGVDVIVNWDKRQYESDTSTKRVQKHREMKRFRNVSETDQKQSTETDTDTLLHGANAPDEETPKKKTCLQLYGTLIIGRLNEKEADWLRDEVNEFGEDAVREALLIALAQRPRNPKSYLHKVLTDRAKQRASGIDPTSTMSPQEQAQLIRARERAKQPVPEIRIPKKLEVAG